jgi:hypothetical protein
MRSVKLLAVSALALASLVGCSAAPESDADLLEAANAGDAVAEAQDELLPILKPDLRFDGSNIVVHDGFTSQPVALGGGVKVNCGTRSLKVTYKEKNAGTGPAGTHYVRFDVAGNAPTSAIAPGLAAGAVQVGVANMFPVLLPANVVVNAAVTLDSTLIVNESNEANNAFPFKLYRLCP